jgi:hypothetical protein
MSTGPLRADHDTGILARLARQGGHGRTGSPQGGGRYGLLLLVLIATYLFSAFNGRNLATGAQLGLFSLILLLAMRSSPPSQAASPPIPRHSSTSALPR